MLQPDAITALVRRLRVLWGALLLSVATFYLVVWVLLRKGGLAVSQELNPTMLSVLAVIVALVLLLAPMLRRYLEGAPKTAGPDEIARRWQTGWIVGQALKEFVGVAGLAIALLAGSPAEAFGFALISEVSMIMTPPWEHEVRLRIHSAEEERGAFLGR